MLQGVRAMELPAQTRTTRGFLGGRGVGDGWLGLIAAILICQGAGVLGVLTTDTGDSPWYRLLRKPRFTPPSWVFGPVWTLLYLMMGVALHRLWRRRDRRAGRVALGFFVVQLVLNAAWTPVFFGARSLRGGLVVIVALWAAIAATIVARWRASRLAAVLLVPYWVWVSFATVLNASIASLNPVSPPAQIEARADVDNPANAS